MGNEQSQLGAAGPGGQPYGFQVLRNTNESLAIEPWFDFICGINGRQIDDGNPLLFRQEVQNCLGTAVTLGIWSAKGQRLRDLVIPLPRPSSTNSKQTALSLGLTLQWTPLSITSNIWHILSVAPSSPSDVAGLLPFSDYILGTPDEGGVAGENGLAELVEQYMDRPLRLWVYNHEFDVVREVTIVPRRGWGGEGALGCVLGFGALHRLPVPLTEGAVVMPGETLFERNSGEMERKVGTPVKQLPLGAVPPPQMVGFPPVDGSGVRAGTPTAPGYQTPTSQYITPAYAAPNLFTSARYSPAPPPPPTKAEITSPPSTPRAGPTPGSPAQFTSPPPPTKHHKPRRHHAIPAGMDEYMRESEQASLEADRPSSAFGNRGGTPVPPPPRGAVPPPPRRAT
ncbi:GRASP55/65 PDZ-like domain-containing protein [Kalaharituber pfeilii]|nr:GRASP55/65 PDZ-like domain-containing protein [Kalaharituber pfeilii]